MKRIFKEVKSKKTKEIYSVLLTYDDEKHVLGKLRGCIGADENYRADIASTLAMRLANYSLVYAKDNVITQKITDRIISLCTKDYFTNDLKYLIVRTIFVIARISSCSSGYLK